MNLAHSRRKMKDDLCEAYIYFPIGFSWFITRHRNAAGGPSLHPHAHRPWLVTCWTQREPCKCGWTLRAERSFWRRSFVPVRDASSLIIPSSQLFTLKYPPKLVFNSQSRFRFESFMGLQSDDYIFLNSKTHPPEKFQLISWTFSSWKCTNQYNKELSGVDAVKGMLSDAFLF